jgi:hypothetical protein
MKELDQYPWCGHGVLMNKTKQAWQNINYVHGLFGDHKREARKRVVSRVADVMDIPPARVTAFGKSPQTVKARSLLCFWAHRRLGMSTVEIAKKLKISQPAVSRSSKRGEQIENEHRFELIPQKA